MSTYLERSCPSCCSSRVALLSLDLLMGSAKTCLKVARFPSRSGFTKDIIAAQGNPGHSLALIPRMPLGGAGIPEMVVISRAHGN